MKKVLQFILKELAKAVLWRYSPKVVAITGSYGKSSAKDAIVCVLQTKFRVRGTYKNYNNELGLPLTIIGSKSGGRSLVSWLKVVFKALGLVIFKNNKYPEFLVLEMGVDHPGDMDYLLSIVRPDVAVLTAIGPAHLEFFSSQENVLKEKIKLAKAVSDSSAVFLNGDDKMLLESRDDISAHVYNFGFEGSRDFLATDWHLADDLSGLRFKLEYKGATVPIFIPNIISHVAVYAVLVGAAVGDFFGLNLVEVSGALATFRLPNGRMNLLNAKKDSLIIDDTYNSSPKTLIAALEVLGDIEYEGRKVAVLGDMLELGDEALGSHKSIGRFIKEAGVDLLVTVGPLSESMTFRSGLEENQIFSFSNSVEAARFMVDNLKSHDLILVKGSQGVRLERVSKALLLDEDRAEELLVRQTDKWKSL